MPPYLSQCCIGKFRCIFHVWMVYDAIKQLVVVDLVEEFLCPFGIFIIPESLDSVGNVCSIVFQRDIVFVGLNVIGSAVVHI